MGKFSFDLKKWVALVPNQYKNNEVLLKVGNDVVDMAKYAELLDEYSKLKTQQVALIVSEIDEKENVELNKALLYYVEKLQEKDIDSGNLEDYKAKSKKVTEDEIKKSSKGVATISKKLKGVNEKLDEVNTKINNYKKESLDALRNGVIGEDNVKLEFSDERFCEYLSFIELENMTIKNKNEAAEAASMATDLTEKLAKDFDRMFPQIVGASQYERITKLKVNPLHLLLVNGKRIDEYAFRKEGSNVGFPRPKGKNGEELRLEDFSGSAEPARIMKAKFMAALVSGKADVRVLNIANADKEYAFMASAPIKVDVAAYKNLEKQWIYSNRKNFEKEVTDVCVDVETSKRLSAELKIDGKDVGVVANETAKAVSQAAKKIRGKDALASISSAKEMQLVFQDHRNKDDVKFIQESLPKGNVYASDLKNCLSYQLKPISSDDKIIKEIIMDYNSAYMDFTPAERINLVTDMVESYYKAMKDNAQELIKERCLADVYNNITRKSSNNKIFNKNDNYTMSWYAQNKETISKDIKGGTVTYNEIVLYSNATIGYISKLEKTLTELKLIKIGSYYTLDGKLASEKFDGKNDQPLDPSVLSQEDKNKFYATLGKIEGNIQLARQRCLELYDHLAIAGVNDVNNLKTLTDEINRLVDPKDMSDDFQNIRELYGKILYKNNGIDEVPVLDASGMKILHERYEDAQNDLKYAFEMVGYFHSKMEGDLVDEDTEVCKEYNKQYNNPELEMLKKKNKEELTEEENQILEKDIQSNYEKLGEIIKSEDSISLNQDVRENKFNAYKCLRELAGTLEEQYKKNYDEEQVVAELTKAGRLTELEKRKVLGTASSETVLEIIKGTWAKGDKEHFKEALTVPQIKRGYIKFMANEKSKLSPVEKKNLNDTIRGIMAPMMPSEQGFDFDKVDFLDENAIYNLKKDFLNDNKDYFDNLSFERRNAHEKVDQIKRQIDEIGSNIERNAALEKYWDGRIALRREIVRLSNDYDDLSKEIPTLNENVEPMSASLEATMEKYVTFAEELTEISELTDSKNSKLMQMKIEDIKKLSFTRSKLNPDEVYLGKDYEKEDNSQEIKNNNQNLTLKMEDVLATNINGKDKHELGKDMKGYDQLSVEEFIKLYQKVRATYANNEGTFAKDNPAMKFRYESIYKMMERLDEEQKARQFNFDKIKLTRENIENELEQTLTAIESKEERMNGYDKQINDKLAEYIKNTDTKIEVVKKDEQLTKEKFLENANILIDAYKESKEEAALNVKKFKDELEKKNLELDEANKEAEQKDRTTLIEGKLNAIKVAQSKFWDILVENTNIFILDKIKQKEEKKAEMLQPKKATAVKTENTIKEAPSNYEQREKEIKTKFKNYKGGIVQKAGEVNPRRKLVADTAIAVNSQTIRNGMGVLYGIKDDNAHINEGNRYDNIRVLGYKLKLVEKNYTDIVNKIGEKEKKKVLTDTSKLIDNKKLKENLSNSFSAMSHQRITGTARKLIDQHCVGDKRIEYLYNDLYPTMYDYVKLTDTVSAILGKLSLEPGKYDLKDAKPVLGAIDQIRHLDKTASQNSREYKYVKMLDDVLNNFGIKSKEDKEKFVTNVYTNNLEYTKSDLKAVEDLCMGFADTEIDMMIRSVENTFEDNKAAIEAKLPKVEAPSVH